MIFNKNIFLAFGVTSLASQASAADCTSIESITCVPVTTAPTLDSNLDDWSSVGVFEAHLTGAMTSTTYPRGNGNVKIQCAYDTEKVYFAFEIPGGYRFSTDDNHLAASISTMFKMGEDAELFNMGNCPLAGECEAAPEGCEPYKVDIGGHWELKTTARGVLYVGNDSTGNDEVANKDDEYAVGPYCRFDDNGSNAANEWSGAWNHTNAEEGASDEGSYIFEMSRSLSTASDETDAQLVPGTAIGFGFAFWDPLETVDAGWTKPGHYVTGCSKDWISLQLVDEAGNFEGPDLGTPLFTTITDEDELKDDAEPTEEEEPKGATVDEGTQNDNAASTNSNIVYAFTTFAFAYALNDLLVW